SIGDHPPRSALIGPPPFHGCAVLALRPACASCDPHTAPCARTNRPMRASMSTCSSFHNPRSCGLMRPSGTTAVASVSTSAAPPTANWPRCTKCQSSAKPSALEYWHIGDTPMRLRKVTPRSPSSSKSDMPETYGRRSLLADRRPLVQTLREHPPEADLKALDELFAASRAGDAVTAWRVLEKSPELAKVTGPHPIWGGEPTALHVAVENGRADVAAMLLRMGA